ERWGLRGELWTLRWEDATQLRYQATRVHAVGLDLMLLLRLFPALGKSVKISFVDVNGKRRKLPSSLKAMDVLAERVIEHHTAAQFPALRSALDRGPGAPPPRRRRARRAQAYGTSAEPDCIPGGQTWCSVRLVIDRAPVGSYVSVEPTRAYAGHPTTQKVRPWSRVWNLEGDLLPVR